MQSDQLTPSTETVKQKTAQKTSSKATKISKAFGLFVKGEMATSDTSLGEEIDKAQAKTELSVVGQLCKQVSYLNWFHD